MKFKQCIVIRADLKLSPGKMAVQAAHAAILALEQTDKKTAKDWKAEGQRKIVLKVPELRDLFNLRAEAERVGIPCAIVMDAGLTEVAPGTITALGMGPASAEVLDAVTRDLKLL